MSYWRPLDGIELGTTEAELCESVAKVNLFKQCSVLRLGIFGQRREKVKLRWQL